jgi:hypothetical protein
MCDMTDDATPPGQANIVEAVVDWSGWRAGPTANQLVAADNQIQSFQGLPIRTLNEDVKLRPW